MVDHPALCGSEQLNDACQGCVGVHLVQQEIPGPGVKQERDGHVGHQEAPENPKWEVWLDPTPDVVVPVRPPGATGSKGGDPTCQEAWGFVCVWGGSWQGNLGQYARGKENRMALLQQRPPWLKPPFSLLQVRALFQRPALWLHQNEQQALVSAPRDHAWHPQL